MMNDIPVLQNAEEQLKLMRARQLTYWWATVIVVVQMMLALGLPIGGAIASILRPEWKSVIGVAALFAIVVDTLWLDRRFKILNRRGAKLGESFDCRVLDLMWDKFNVGDKVDVEDVNLLSKAFSRRHNDSKITNWYPVVVGEMPMHLARIVCQRSNIRYDSNLRRSYSASIMVLAVALLMLFVLIGVVQSASMADWVLTMAPVVPFLSWSAKEYYRQRDTADTLETLFSQVKKLWDDGLSGSLSLGECQEISRNLQTALYRHRASSPLILPFVYPLMRSSLEHAMNASASDFVQEYQNSLIRSETGV